VVHHELHCFPVPMHQGRQFFGECVERLGIHKLLLQPLCEHVQPLNPVHVPGLLAHQVGGQPRLLHLPEAFAAVALVVTQTPRRYRHALFLQHLAGLLGILAHC